jgi:hypothetical protein
MKLPPKSAQRLALPAAIGLAFVVAGVVAVVIAGQLLQKARAEQAGVANERVAAQNKHTRAADEEREIRERLVDYRKLLERGLVGEERRLDWVDRIAEIKANRKLPELKYSIEPQRTIDVPGTAPSTEVEVLGSRLTLDMALLHEEDLLRFLTDLRRSVNAYVLVRACTLERSAAVAPADRGAAPRLRARCDIDLVTIRDKRLAAAPGGSS